MQTPSGHIPEPYQTTFQTPLIYPPDIFLTLSRHKQDIYKSFLDTEVELSLSSEWSLTKIQLITEPKFWGASNEVQPKAQL